jgi:hypothetical protein
MGLLSALGTAVAVTMETSRAASAARQSLRSGAPLAEAVRAFARETETDLDDRVVEELIDGTEQVVELARQAAITALKWAPRLDTSAARAISQGRRLLDWAEEHLPDLRNGLTKFARGASRVANEAEKILGK